jgi:hypothetical protein
LIHSHLEICRIAQALKVGIRWSLWRYRGTQPTGLEEMDGFSHEKWVDFPIQNGKRLPEASSPYTSCAAVHQTKSCPEVHTVRCK